MINLEENKMPFLITGGSGYIGSRLVKEILRTNNSVTILTRNKKPNTYNLRYIDNLDGDFNYDVVINLCGAPISQRWSKKSMAKIYASRIDVTKKIVQKILESKIAPKLVINASAVGFYGTSVDEKFSENSSPTAQNLFSQKLCSDWESEIQKISGKSRLAIIRLGVVIGKDSAILKKMLPAFKFGLGAIIGKGSQYLSWVHIDDVIAVVQKIIADETMRGIYNLCAPNAVTNAEFSNVLAKKLHRFCIFKMPNFAVKILFGQMGQEILLNGQNVYPARLLQHDYNFKYEKIDNALEKSL